MYQIRLPPYMVLGTVLPTIEASIKKGKWSWIDVTLRRGCNVRVELQSSQRIYRAKMTWKWFIISEARAHKKAPRNNILAETVTIN